MFAILNYPKNKKEYKHVGINIQTLNSSTIYTNSNNSIILLFTGTIYNINILQKWLHLNDINEIIITLYQYYGIEYTLTLLEGVFTFLLLDQRINSSQQESIIYLVRDCVGLIPVYILRPLDSVKEITYIISTDYQYISQLHSPYHQILRLNQNCYKKFTLSHKVSSYWKLHNMIKKYSFQSILCDTRNNYLHNIQTLIIKAVEKRINHCIVNKKTIICILDNTYESSLITILINKLSTSFTCLSLYDTIIPSYIQCLGIMHTYLPENATIDYKQENCVFFSSYSANTMINNHIFSHDESVLKKDYIYHQYLKDASYINKTMESIEYPLLDVNFIHYFLSIDLEYKYSHNLIKTSFQSFF